MTLTEYINQEDPIAHPTVVLVDGEFQVNQTIKVGRDTLTMITIPILHTKYGITGNYIKKNHGSELYAQDEHGNPRSLSVFLLPV